MYESVFFVWLLMSLVSQESFDWFVVKRIRKLYGFKYIVGILMKDTDQEIIHILSTHPLTKELYRNDVQIDDEKKDDDMSIVLDDLSIFSG